MTGRRALVALAAAALGGCTTFEDPTIILDLRVIAMRAEPPEQVIDVDPDTPDLDPILDQLGGIEFSALVADPGAERPLRWSMTLCLLDEGRCDRARPLLELGTSAIDDPDTSLTRQVPLALVRPDDARTRQALAAMFVDALTEDPVQALAGIELGAELRIGPLDGPRADDVVAVKRVRIAPRVPAARAPNANPFVSSLDGAIGNARIVLPRDLRCAAADFQGPIGDPLPVVSPGTVITLYPIEPEGVREAYVSPTLDGQIAALTETLEYQWLARAGSFSDQFTGGGRDLLGNQALLGSDWRAPPVSGPTDISVWMIQRDERLGATWFESCIRVVP